MLVPSILAKWRTFPMKIYYLASRMRTLLTLFFLYYIILLTVTINGLLNVVINYCHIVFLLYCICAYALWVTAMIMRIRKLIWNQHAGLWDKLAAFTWAFLSVHLIMPGKSKSVSHYQILNECEICMSSTSKRTYSCSKNQRDRIMDTNKQPNMRVQHVSMQGDSVVKTTSRISCLDSSYAP